MRSIVVATSLAAALAASGCISISTTVEVKPDGSGRVVQSVVMGKEMIEMFKGMSQGMGEGGSAKGSFEPFSEKEARDKVANMGPGVTFSSSRPLKSEQGEGREAIYTFQDVNGLRIEDKPGPAGEQKPGTESNQPTFSLKKLANGNSLLKVTFPAQAGEKKPGASAEAPAAPGKKHEPSEQELNQMRQVLKGLKMAIAVDVQGTIVRTNCPFVQGKRVTLMELDFDKLLANEAKLKELAAVEDKKSFEAVKQVLKDLPGFKVNLTPVVEIEFK